MSRGAKKQVKCRCGAVFLARVADIKRGWGKYCSKSCKAKEQEERTGQYASHLYRQERRDEWNEAAIMNDAYPFGSLADHDLVQPAHVGQFVAAVLGEDGECFSLRHAQSGLAVRLPAQLVWAVAGRVGVYVCSADG